MPRKPKQPIRKRRRNQPAGKDVVMAERRAQALERRKAGDSYRAIGRALGVSERTAYYDVQDALGALDAIVGEKAERLRELEMQRLDVLHRCLAKGIKKGDPRAVLAAVRVSERRCKLLSLDGPVTIAGGDGGAVPVRIVHEHHPGPSDVTGAGRGPA